MDQPHRRSPARANPRPGSLVVSFDGKRVGRLERVAGDHLKIHRRLGRDYWIPDALVRRRLGAEVILHVDRRTIRRYRRPCPPGAAPAEPGVAAGTAIGGRRTPILGGSALLVMILLATSILLVACDDDDPVLADRGPTMTLVTEATPASGSEIVLMADGFEPASLEVARGASVTIRNDSDRGLSILLRGTGEDEDDPREIDAGDILELAFESLGAQVITIADNPDSAATIMVVPPDAAE